MLRSVSRGFRQLTTTQNHAKKALKNIASFSSRNFSTANDEMKYVSEPREEMEYDVVTVGGGPAGLAAAIRLKQLSIEKGIDLSVCVIDKGSTLGSHIISGNVFEPRALNELFPNWREMEGLPEMTKAESDNFLIMTDEKNSISIPHIFHPPQLSNEGNYIISLSQLVRWLGEQAESLGVEIYPGFAADEIIYSQDGATVIGIATKDSGISKSGEVKDSFSRGIALLGKQIILSEGCRGSLTEELIHKFNLRKDKDEQTYGLGIKEVWKIDKSKLVPGKIQHSVGWPLDMNTFGGTFLYHQKPDLVHLGMVVGLDYANPYISPYKEFQKWKHHPSVSAVLEGGECISYGARCLNEGGFHAIPKLTFPGGLLIGCGAGFLNAVKIKGSHTAMKSGMLAAEAIFKTIENPVEKKQENEESSLIDNLKGKEIVEYEKDLYNSWVGAELKEIRNTHSSFKYGLIPGMIYTGLSTFLLKGREPWTFQNKTKDCDKTKPAKEFTKIEYKKPDGVISFDLLINLQRSGTNHDHDQPSHLRVKPVTSLDKNRDNKDNSVLSIPLDISLKVYDGPEQRFCPAGVYEYIPDEEHNKQVEKSTGKCENKMKLVINAQNCVHCKCCSIKTPREFIKWTVPEGGGGPAYTVM